MTSQIHFFATRSDLEPGLRAIEARRPLKYVLLVARDSPESEALSSLLATENLGRSRTGDHVTGDCYLVAEAKAKIRVESVRQRRGGVRYFVNQAENPKSLVFWPGGLYGDDALVCGHIGTVSRDPDALELYRQFAAAITGGFEKIGNYRVGAAAARLLDQGVRLVTMGVRSPREYDLKRT